MATITASYDLEVERINLGGLTKFSAHLTKTASLTHIEETAFIPINAGAGIDINTSWTFESERVSSPPTLRHNPYEIPPEVVNILFLDVDGVLRLEDRRYLHEEALQHLLQIKRSVPNLEIV